MKKISNGIGVAAFMMLAAACSRPADLEKIVVGQDVAVTKSDGGVVEGKVTSRDDQNVEVRSGGITKAIPNDQIVDVTVVDASKPVDLPQAAKFYEYTVPAGTAIPVRLATAVSSRTSRAEDRVEATLVEAVSVGDIEVLPAGSSVTGTVLAAEASGKVKGLARIALLFTSLSPAGRDDRYEINAGYAETAHATKTADATKIGIGAGAGAVVGGILGGGDGAAKGAVIGGGAGTGVVLATAGKEVAYPVGARLTVTLKNDVEVRMPIN